MSQGVPELEVLSRYIGTWIVAATENGNQAAAGQYSTEWILDGRFTQTTGSVKTADGSSFEIKTLITFDSARSSYRWWSFFSNGHTEESTGSWNSDTQAMTRITHYGDITQTVKSDFSQPGIEKWVIENRDQVGNLVSEMSGTNTRVAE